MRRFASAFTFFALCAFASASVYAKPKVRIALAGDSTVTDKAGWGIGLAQMLRDDVELTNHSRGGRSSRTFIQEGRWQAILDAKPDYVLIQFGHNDQPGTDRSTNLATEYPAFMRQYVTEARAAGIVPILVTPLVRREFREGPNTITSSLAPWAEAVRKISVEDNVPLIELHDRSKAICEAMGKDACVAVLSNTKPGGFDGTHLTFAGNMLFGAVVASELKRVMPSLVPHLRDVPASSETLPPATSTGGGGDRPAATLDRIERT